MMSQRLTDSRIANLGAQTIAAAFDAYHEQFKAITRRARTRFEERDWQGMHADAAERLDLYRQVVGPTVLEIRELFGARVEDRLVWAGVKAVYSSVIAERHDWELAETFFNSVSRRIFTTVGVNPAVEFVDSDFATPPTTSSQTVYRAYEQPGSPVDLVQRILQDHQHRVPYEDQRRDAELTADHIARALRAGGAPPFVERAEVVTSVFYRSKGAYLIGRVFGGGVCLPMAIALLNRPGGVLVDAVVLDEGGMSIIFSFAHWYFHVDVERPYDLALYLNTLMPRKRLSELYISLGYHKHGKTELYRELLHSLSAADAQFDIAPGQRGMVMEVFTLPGVELAVKLIKDHFDEPKRTTRAAVMQKYHLVFRRDRAGRLVDAQEFEHLQFKPRSFSSRLLEELERVAARTVSRVDGQVIVKHAYVERRVTPLDIYLREAEEEKARSAVIEFGNAIKDLAASNIFPGDLLLKNFGVTRHGRVVFYDYDELCLLTDCHFRPLPQPVDDADEWAGEAWFYAAENEVFPEEFRSFLRFPRKLGEVFLQQHGEIFEVAFWQKMQERLRAGEVIDVFPYARSTRLNVSRDREREDTASSLE